MPRGQTCFKKRTGGVPGSEDGRRWAGPAAGRMAQEEALVCEVLSVPVSRAQHQPGGLGSGGIRQARLLSWLPPSPAQLPSDQPVNLLRQPLIPHLKL